VRGNRFVEIKVFGFRLTIDLDDKGISRTLWLFGQRELDHKWILENSLDKGSTVLDIGANIGYYLLMEDQLIGEKGRIIAVEPVASNLKLLKKNTKQASAEDIVILEGAVSNISGPRTFYLARESNLNTFHKHVLESRGNLTAEVVVPTYTLEQLVSRYGEFDYLRMDIEGHEVEVLEGVAKLYGKVKKMPKIIFETHPRTYHEGHAIAPILEQLYNLGYCAEYVASSSERGTKILQDLGYGAVKKIRTDEVFRTVHTDIAVHDLVKCLEETGGIRTVLLVHDGSSARIEITE
jgi:FkbM family methyltransferase